MDTVTHLAGPGVNIKGRGIQRCIICGEKLIDTKNMMVPVGSGPVSPWPEGAYVRFKGKMQITLLEKFPDVLPDDLCIVLVEEC